MQRLVRQPGINSSQDKGLLRPHPFVRCCPTSSRGGACIPQASSAHVLPTLPHLAASTSSPSTARYPPPTAAAASGVSALVEHAVPLSGTPPDAPKQDDSAIDVHDDTEDVHRGLEVAVGSCGNTVVDRLWAVSLNQEQADANELREMLVLVEAIVNLLSFPQLCVLSRAMGMLAVRTTSRSIQGKCKAVMYAVDGLLWPNLMRQEVMAADMELLHWLLIGFAYARHPPRRFILITMQNAVAGRMSSLSGDDLSRLSWAFGKLGFKASPDFWAALQQEAAGKLRELGPHALVSLVTGMRFAGVRVNKEFMAHVFRELHAKVGDMAPHDIAQLVVTAGDLHVALPRELAQELMAAVEQQLDTFPTPRLAMFTFGLARGACAPCQHFVDKAVAKVQADRAVSPKFASMFAWGLGLWSAKVPGSYLEASLQHLEEKLDAYELKQVSSMVYGLATLGARIPQPLGDLILSRTQSNLQQIKPSELANLLHGLVMGQVHVPQPFVDAVLARVLPSLGQLRATDHGLMMGALQRTGAAVSPEYMAAMLRALEGVLPGCAPAQLAVMIRRLASLQVPDVPPQLQTVVLSCVVDKMDAMPAKDFLFAVWGLGVLRIPATDALVKAIENKALSCEGGDVPAAAFGRFVRGLYQLNVVASSEFRLWLLRLAQDKFEQLNTSQALNLVPDLTGVVVQVQPKHFMTIMLQRLQPEFPNMSCLSVCRLVWACARANVRPPQGFVKAALRVVAEKSAYLVPYSVVNLLWGLATLQVHRGGQRQPIHRHVLRRLEEVLPTMSARQCASMTWALATLSVPMTGELTRKLLEAVEAKLAEFNPQGYANLMWGLVSLDKPVPEAVAAAAFSCLTSNPAEFKEKEVTMLLWALAKRGFHAPANGGDGLLPDIQLRLQKGLFPPKELTAILWSLTLVYPSVPPPLVEAWLGMASENVAHFSLGGMSQLARAFLSPSCTLKPPAHFCAAVAEAVASQGDNFASANAWLDVCAFLVAGGVSYESKQVYWLVKQAVHFTPLEVPAATALLDVMKDSPNTNLTRALAIVLTPANSLVSVWA